MEKETSTATVDGTPDGASPSRQPDKKGVTFVVEADVEPSGPNSYGKNPRRYQEAAIEQKEAVSRMSEAWKTMLPSSKGSIEAMSPPPPGTVAVFTKQNMLVKAVHAAFYDHHPLILSPDVIWITIAQGLANHVDQNSETLRHRFVSHEGKKDITIVREEFHKGSSRNDWESVFPEFAAQIDAKTTPGTAELITCDFSTTTPVEKIASQIALMDTVQQYFTYTLCGGCGIPSVTLRGTSADWEKVRAKAERLKAYDIDWWLDHLLPALDEFVAASRGEPNMSFWRAVCHINVGGSMPHYAPLTGWINVFFPYFNEPKWRGSLLQQQQQQNTNFDESKAGEAKKKLVRNETIGAYAKSVKSDTHLGNFASKIRTANVSGNGEMQMQPIGTMYAPKLEKFPPSMSSAPFLYVDLVDMTTHRMAFFGGITALVQHPDADGAIEPMVGWAVLDSGIRRDSDEVVDESSSLPASKRVRTSGKTEK